MNNTVTGIFHHLEVLFFLYGVGILPSTDLIHGKVGHDHELMISDGGDTKIGYLMSLSGESLSINASHGGGHDILRFGVVSISGLIEDMG